MHAAHTVVQARCLELEAELSKLLDKLKYQNLKESFENNTSSPAQDAPDFDSVFVIEKMKAFIQGKDNAIKKLRMQISQLKESRSEADRTLDFRALDFQITQLTEKVNVLQEQNELFRAENAKIKQHYKELYDSIKITRAKHIKQTTTLLTKNENLKAQIHENMKCITMDSVKPKVLAPGRFIRDALDITPTNNDNPCVAPPSSDTVIEYFNTLGYPNTLRNVSAMFVNALYQPWRAILSMINMCLTGKTAGYDRPRYPVLQILWGIIHRSNIDYAKRIWEEFVQIYNKHFLI
ncbi:hypothetical protein Tco_0676910 [Tanacetum coccineum]